MSTSPPSTPSTAFDNVSTDSATTAALDSALPPFASNVTDALDTGSLFSQLYSAVISALHILPSPLSLPTVRSLFGSGTSAPSHPPPPFSPPEDPPTVQLLLSIAVALFCLLCLLCLAALLSWRRYAAAISEYKADWQQQTASSRRRSRRKQEREDEAEGRRDVRDSRPQLAGAAARERSSSDEGGSDAAGEEEAEEEEMTTPLVEGHFLRDPFSQLKRRR